VLPVFETDEQSTFFLTVLSINPEFSDHESDQENNQESDQVSDQEIQVLKFTLTAKSRGEILDHIGLSNHTTNYQRHIEPLLGKN
jgi:ATP-dependent DNA helicase RecG